MTDASFEPTPGTPQYALMRAQSTLELYSMPALSKIPENIKEYEIKGERVSYNITFFVEPSPEGEKLLWVSLYVPTPTNYLGGLLTLTPFPQGEAGEKILNLLQDAVSNDYTVEEILPQLENLGKEVNGVGWRPALELPLKKRVELSPMSYLSPPLEQVIKNDPSVGTCFISTRNTNGKYEVCTSKIDRLGESVSFSFSASEDDKEPKLIKQIEVPFPPSLRADPTADKEGIFDYLMTFAKALQTDFYEGGAEAAIQRIERFNVKFNTEESLAPGSTKDDRLRLMVSLRPPYEFMHAFESGAFVGVEAGDDVVSLVLKASPKPQSSGFVTILDRAQLNLSDTEWATRRQDFIDAARLLATESEAVQSEALAKILTLSTQQVARPALVANILGDNLLASTELLVERYPGLAIRSDVGVRPSEIRRLCDGVDVLVISRAVSKLGSESLASFNQLTIELGPNGDLDFTARNLLGNQASGRLSAEAASFGGGRARVAVFLASWFAEQVTENSWHSFETAVQRAVDLDPKNSFFLTEGHAQYLDLPQLTDPEGVQAFAIAERCAREICQNAGGYGKHQAAAVSQGTAQLRVQFPEAPYNLVLTFHDNVIFQAGFYPKKSADGQGKPLYRFLGDHQLERGNMEELRLLIVDFAKWGRDHSLKIGSAPALEETLAFNALKRLLPTGIASH